MQQLKVRYFWVLRCSATVVVPACNVPTNPVHPILGTSNSRHFSLCLSVYLAKSVYPENALFVINRLMGRNTVSKKIHSIINSFAERLKRKLVMWILEGFDRLQTAVSNLQGGYIDVVDKENGDSFWCRWQTSIFVINTVMSSTLR